MSLQLYAVFQFTVVNRFCISPPSVLVHNFRMWKLCLEIELWLNKVRKLKPPDRFVSAVLCICWQYGAEFLMRNWQFLSYLKIPDVLWSPNIHDGVHKSPRLDSVLSHIVPLHVQSYLFKIYFNISSYLRLVLPSGFLPLGFPSKPTYTSLSLVRVTCSYILVCYLLHCVVYFCA